MRGLASALVLAAVAVAACTRRSAVAPPDAGEVRWLKGQTHVHSSNSGDSQTPPEAVARWYAAHGYDFIVMTDHNRVTTLSPVGGMLVIPGVEVTLNLPTCEPPPEPGLSCLLHVNGLFVSADRMTKLIEPVVKTRAELYGAAIDAVKQMGGLAQVNHPNFHYGAGVPELVAAARRGAVLVEVANEAVDSNNAGDGAHPSTEALWRAALDAGVKLYAVASDDAHHYDDAAEVTARGEQAFVGDRGFIMVRATKDPASIRAAMERGDFYAVTLDGGRLTQP